MGERWNGLQCAAHAGVKWVTWRSFVSRRRHTRAPAHAGFNPATGEKEWDADEVRAWVQSRPGRGRHWDDDE